MHSTEKVLEYIKIAHLCAFKAKCQESVFYQLITRYHGHEVDALELSSVGKKRISAGVQDLIAHLH